MLYPVETIEYESCSDEGSLHRLHAGPDPAGSDDRRGDHSHGGKDTTVGRLGIVLAREFVTAIPVFALAIGTAIANKLARAVLGRGRAANFTDSGRGRN